jgi:hypothetical protein
VNPWTDDFWVSSNSMTVCVTVSRKSRLIQEAPPIVKKFVGQPLGNLSRWMQRQGGFQIESLRGGSDEQVCHMPKRRSKSSDGQLVCPGFRGDRSWSLQ